MARYEKRVPKGVDFIDVRIRDKSIQTTAGRVGDAVKPRTTKHGSVRMAQSRFLTAIRAARKKGFVHVASQHEPVENPALEQAVFEQPDHDAPRLVYGDWLQEQGDPRGELIAIQHELAGATGRRAKSLRTKETALISEHSSAWFGTLDEILHETSYAKRPHVRVAWRLGFFDEVEVRLAESPVASYGQFGMEPDRKMSDVLKTLAALQSARFVTRIVLGGFAADYTPALRVLATGWPKPLRSLVITGALGGESTQQPHVIGSLAAFCKAHPDLERLSVYLRDELPGVLALPKLEHLALWTNRMPSKNQLRDLVRGSWPRLASLEFDVGAADGVADLAPVFSAKLFPALETLRIGWIPDVAYAAELAAMVRKSTLDLERFVITGPQWGNKQELVLPVVQNVFAGTKVAVSIDSRET